MKQHALRLPDEIFDAINDARGDVPRNTWIVRALESTLREVGGLPSPRPGDLSKPMERNDGPLGSPGSPASTRMSAAMARQAKLNAAKAGKR